MQLSYHYSTTRENYAYICSVMLDILAIHWNIDPVLLHLGPISLRWYSLLFVSGFIFGWYMVRSFYRREGVDEKLLDPLLYTMLISVIVGARLGHCIFYDPQYYFGSWQGFLEVFQPWQGGLASHGGAIGIIIGLLWYVNKYGKKEGFDFFWLADRIVLVVCFAGACIRLGNFFNSEIIGYNTTLPWGIVFDRTGDPNPKHPTMLYEALTYLTMGVVMIWLYRKKLDKLYRGELFGIFLTFCFGMRGLLEFTKAPSVTVFTIGDVVINMGHLLSFPFAIAGIAFWIWSVKRGVPATIQRQPYRTPKKA